MDFCPLVFGRTSFALLCRHDKPVEVLQLLATLPFLASRVGAQVRRDSAPRPRVGQIRAVHPQLCRKGPTCCGNGDRGRQQRRWPAIEHARALGSALYIHDELRLTTTADKGRGWQRIRQAQRCRRREQICLHFPRRCSL